MMPLDSSIIRRERFADVVLLALSNSRLNPQKRATESLISAIKF